MLSLPSQRLLIKNVPSLRTLGIGVAYFPKYINHKLNLHSLDVVLLSFIIRGQGRHVIDDTTFEERGASLGVTHYGQRHDILTDEQGMDIINVYLNLKVFPLFLSLIRYF